MDVTTKARVQALLASGGQKTAPLDSLIPTLISGVSAAFELHLGRPLEATSRTETFDADPTVRRFFLRAAPVSAVASVKYDPDRVFGADTLIDSDSYAVDEDLGIVILDGYVLGSFSPRAVQVVYTGGLGADQAALEAAFPELVHAADLQVAHLAKQRHALGATSISAGGGSTAFVGGYDLLPEVRSILELLRRRGAR